MKRVPIYIDKISKRPEDFFKYLTKANSRRPSDTSCNQVIFQTTVPSDTSCNQVIFQTTVPIRGVFRTQSNI